MDLFQKLTILNSIASSLTLVFIFVAMLPHVKQGATVLRDALLWIMLVGVIVFLGWLGARRIAELDDSPQMRDAQVRRSSDVTTKDWSGRQDRYYAGSR